MPFTFYQLAWYFFIYAFLGWCLEVVFCTVNSGQWVNRGFLNGPVCPIYGVGMCVVLLALWPLVHNALLLFLGSMVLTSALELAPGVVKKTASHPPGGDFPARPHNRGGHIGWRSAGAGGGGGGGAGRLLPPPVARLVEKLPQPLGWTLLGVLAAVLAADIAATLTTLAGLERDLRELDRLATALRRGSDAVSRELGDAALAADEKLEEGRRALPGRLASMQARRDLLRAALLDSRLFGPRRLLRAFPGMHSLRHREILEGLKEELEKRLQQRLRR